MEIETKEKSRRKNIFVFGAGASPRLRGPAVRFLFYHKLTISLPYFTLLFARPKGAGGAKPPPQNKNIFSAWFLFGFYFSLFFIFYT